MPMIQWSKRFELGVKFIDDDHKVLVDLINRMNEASRMNGALSDVGAILSALVDYTRYHFAREEQAQRISGYPDVDDHKVKHHELATKAAGLFEDFRKDPASVDVGDLLDFMSDWLMDHILLHDMAIRPYILASKEAVISAETVSYTSVLSDMDDPVEVDWGNLSVLVLEDSRAFASVLNAILKNIGVGQVDLTSTVDEAMEKATTTAYNVILTDWRLSESDGMDFIRLLRQQGINVPVVVLTGYVDESMESTREGFSASEWLQKPITSAELTSCLLRQIA